MEYTLHKFLLPTASPFADEVTELWRELFGQEEVDGTRAQFAGAEVEFDEDTLYVLEAQGKLGACCHITRRKGTGLAMFGGVASAECFRGEGFGRLVCEFAMRDFDLAGGEAIWLCTGNPIAANLYESIGFRYVGGAHVMARLKNGLRGTDVPKRLYPGGECVAKAASPEMRVQMIPLICGRNNVAVLDANVALCSTNCMALSSCTGLYPRFLKVRERGGECFFLQDKANGSVVGLATGLPAGEGTIHADAFWRQEYAAEAPKLIEALQQKSPGKALRFAVADKAKEEILLTLGARKEGTVTMRLGQFLREGTSFLLG